MSDDIDIDFDDDMMDGFEDFDTFDNPSDDQGERNPIMSVTAGAIDKATSADTAMKMSRTIAENALPSGFKVALDSTDSLAGSISDIYKKTSKDLEEPIKDLKKLVNGSIQSATFLPQAIRDKIAKATETSELPYSQKVDPRELEIQEATNRIFASMSQQNAETAQQTAEAENLKTLFA